MNWVWFIGGTWTAVGIALALLIGRSIHLANLKAEEAGRDHVSVSAVMPAPASPPAIESDGPTPAPIRRPSQSPSSSARSSPLVGGCVSPAERAPAQREHGVL